MRPLTTAELLTIWETGIHQTLLDRQLTLLATACAIPLTEAARLSIGERDIRLLLLRERYFGTTMAIVSTCPKCGEKVEWEMNTHQLHLQEPVSDPPPVFMLASTGRQVGYRLPNSADMKLVSQFKHHYDLLKLCIVSIDGKQFSTEDPELPDQVFADLDLHMAQTDPQANIHFDLICPACQHQWVSFFDIMSYLWVEVDRWARRTFQEIYLLARGLGWSEQEILALSPARRQTYLNMLQA